VIVEGGVADDGDVVGGDGAMTLPLPLIFASAFGAYPNSPRATVAVVRMINKFPDAPNKDVCEGRTPHSWR